MQCPACGGDSGTLALVVGIVKISTHRCKECGRAWKHKELLVQFSASILEKEIRRLKANGDVSAQATRTAIQFLNVKLESHAASALDEDAARQKRRNDLWERRYLREALGDDYL